LWSERSREKGPMDQSLGNIKESVFPLGGKQKYQYYRSGLTFTKKPPRAAKRERVGKFKGIFVPYVLIMSVLDGGTERIKQG